MKYLIDTDWLVNHLRGLQRVTRKLEEIVPEGIALSIISLAELYEGIYRSTNPARDEESLRRFLGGITILGIDEEICKIFGRERAKLRKEGKLIGDLDLLIASTCLHHNLTLLTDNIREFERVESLKIL
jgi:tRNA(fMet)-specific endonuclease VapC